VVLLAELDVDRVGDGERVVEHVRAVGEPLAHLRAGLEVEAAVVVHAVLVLHVLADADAQQDVVRVVVALLEEVRVVGGDHGEAELGAQPEDLPVELRLPLRIVRLDLEVVAVLEDVRVPLGGLAGRVPAVVHEVPGHLAREARRGDDDPLAVRRQQLAVDARLHVEALEVGERRELDEVPVARRVAREEHEVVVRLGAGLGAPALEPRAGGDVGLHAEDRLELGLAGLLLELPRRVHVAVIRHGERRHLELLGAADQRIDPVGAVEKRVLGVAVQVDEAHRAPTIADRGGSRYTGLNAWPVSQMTA
jgi:hypothetical protein